MRLKLLFIFCLTCFGFEAQAQESVIEDIDSVKLKKYIELARLNFPRKKVIEARMLKSKTALTATSLGVLDVFNAAYFYRPDNKSTINLNNPYYFNGFQFGLNLNLGNLLSKPALIKGAKADYEAAKAEDREYDISLVSEVKSRYYDYLLAKKTLQLRNAAALNLKGIINDAKMKYEGNEITIEQYTNARNASTEAETFVLTAETAYLKTKNALEDIIGGKIENVK